MTFVKFDRIKESSATTGTGAMTLAGAVAGFRSFASVCANGDTFGYTIEAAAPGDWETGIGTWNTGGTMSRSVVSSSNANALVNFTGATTIYMSLLATQVMRLRNPVPTFPAISNLQLRLSAEFSTLTKTTDQRVTAITDLSGNSRTTSSASTLGRPWYFARRFNGAYPCLWLDGSTNLHLQVTIPNIAAPLTVVIVCEELTQGSSDGNLYRDNSIRGVGYQQAGGNWSIFGTSAGFSNSAAYSQGKPGVQSGPFQVPSIRMDVYNNASSIIRNNGVDYTGTATSSGTVLGGVLNIGNGSPNPTNPTTAAAMLLYEFLIFDKALSSAERTQLDTYYATAVDIAF